MFASLTDQDVGLLRTRFAEDGVVLLPRALDEVGMKHAERAFEWSLHHPGPNASSVLANSPGSFYQDHTNPRAVEIYEPLLVETGLAQLAAHLIGSRHLWFLYEQIWLKANGARRATPWHQDIAYIPLGGEHAITIWLNLDPVPEDCSLGFIPGSHRGPLYNPTAFDPWPAPIEWSGVSLSAWWVLAPPLVRPAELVRGAEPAIARPLVPVVGSPTMSAGVRYCNGDARIR